MATYTRTPLAISVIPHVVISGAAFGHGLIKKDSFLEHITVFSEFATDAVHQVPKDCIFQLFRLGHKERSTTRAVGNDVGPKGVSVHGEVIFCRN